MRRLAIFVILLFLVSGCGVSKNRYNELLREKDELNDQLTMAMAEKANLKRGNEKLTTELSTARTELEKALGEKMALRQEFDRLVDEKVTLKNEHDRLLREKQVLESRVFELEKKIKTSVP
ncbi:MAG: hypothetical protein HY590_07140 [Candidatus Omnitrophica bacterium]|nr:hypothetical protein [Candidatus Omnitrophota bacterium]